VADPEDRTDVAYILRRLLLIIPTLVIILLVNFVIVQAAPAARWNRPSPTCKASAGRVSAVAPAKPERQLAPAVAWTRN
jgi:ABC-type microcin C transport system permease subunit YejB